MQLFPVKSFGVRGKYPVIAERAGVVRYVAWGSLCIDSPLIPDRVGCFDLGTGYGPNGRLVITVQVHATNPKTGFGLYPETAEELARTLLERVEVAKEMARGLEPDELPRFYIHRFCQLARFALGARNGQ